MSTPSISAEVANGTLKSKDREEEEEERKRERELVIGDEAEYSLSLFSLPFCYRGDLAAVLIPHGLIKDRIRQLAHQIHAQIGDRPLTLLCVLKGSYRFFTALVDHLAGVRHQCHSPMQVEFVRAQSYVDQCSAGDVAIQGMADIGGQCLRGANVLLIDDISDTGLTMTRMVGSLRQKIGPGGRVWTAVLLCKRTPKRRADALREDFVAFSIPDKFIVGFGLDYNQMFRELAHICVLSESGVEKYKSTKND